MWWLSGNVYDSATAGPWFELHWIHRVLRLSVLGRVISGSQPSNREAQEKPKYVSRLRDMAKIMLKPGVKHHSVNPSRIMQQTLRSIITFFFQLFSCLCCNELGHRCFSPFVLRLSKLPVYRYKCMALFKYSLTILKNVFSS